MRGHGSARAHPRSMASSATAGRVMAHPRHSRLRHCGQITARCRVLTARSRQGPRRGQARAGARPALLTGTDRPARPGPLRDEAGTARPRPVCAAAARPRPVGAAAARPRRVSSGATRPRPVGCAVARPRWGTVATALLLISSVSRIEGGIKGGSGIPSSGASSRATVGEREKGKANTGET